MHAVVSHRLTVLHAFSSNHITRVFTAECGIRTYHLYNCGSDGNWTVRPFKRVTHLFLGVVTDTLLKPSAALSLFSTGPHYFTVAEPIHLLKAKWGSQSFSTGAFDRRRDPNVWPNTRAHNLLYGYQLYYTKPDIRYSICRGSYTVLRCASHTITFINETFRPTYMFCFANVITVTLFTNINVVHGYAVCLCRNKNV